MAPSAQAIASDTPLPSFGVALRRFVVSVTLMTTGLVWLSSFSG